MDISQELSKIPKDELKLLAQKSDFQGFKTLIINWLLIMFSFYLVAFYPNPLTVIVALIILGGRILGLAILMHDASHNALFKTSFLNTFFGKWFCAAPILADLDGYRTYHLKHHHKAGTEEDPDRSNYINYPVTKDSLRRKFTRDLTGITGLKTLVILYKMSAGLIAYQLSYDQVTLEREKEAFYKPFFRAMKNLFPNLLVNTFMFLFFWAQGIPFIYLLWPASFLTTYMLFSRIRNAAEHAATPDNSSLDPRENTRTTYANWLERLTVAPNNVNFHLEHHILASIPGHNLKAFHNKLKEANILDNADIQPGYLAVLGKLVGS